MPIKVNISISAGGRLKPVSSHTLHEKRITIGRDKECTLSLEDTQKHVSRTHAELEEQDGAYWMKVVSKVNPVVVNGKRFMYGERVGLKAGDHIGVGLYKLEVVEAVVPPPAPKPAPRPKPEASPEDITYVARRGDFPKSAPSAPIRLPDLPADQAESTFIPTPPPSPSSATPAAPVAPVAKAFAPPPPPPPAPVPAQSAESEEATYVPPVQIAPPSPVQPAPQAPTVTTHLPESALADDEVTYIPPMWARPASKGGAKDAASSDNTNDGSAEDMTGFRRPPAEETRPQSPAPAGAPVEPSPEEASEGVDFDLSDAFEEEATSVRVASSPAPAAEPEPAPPPSPEPEVEEDFSEDLTYVRRPPPRPASLAPRAEDLAEEETHYRAPVPEVRPAPVSAGRSQPTPGPQGSAVDAFLEGAGLGRLQVEDPEQFMRDTGIMVRAAVEGIMMLLIARDEARKELGVEATPGADDNPLRSMASPAEVIAFLFDPKRPAIAGADPVQEFGDACSDLRAHQVALFAGMRAAVVSALRGIDPKQIEREHGVNLGGLNLTRKSKLWDIYVTRHEQLTRDVEEGFSKAFGPDLLSAYLAQVRKIRGGRS